MKWPASVLFGCVLATAWARTIPLDVERIESSRAERTEASDAALKRDRLANLIALRTADRAYRQLARADSLLTLLPAAPDVNVGLPAALRPVGRDSVLANLARELASVGEPRARIGVFLVDNAYGHRPGTPLNRPRGERELYVGTDSAGAYCAMVATAPVGRDGMVIGNARISASAGASVLGPCAFVVRYGAPGAGISRWLRGGAYRLAELHGAGVHHAPAENAETRDEMMWSPDHRTILGCIGGRDDLCTDVLLMSARTSAVSDDAAAFDLTRQFPIGIAGRALLHHLEQQFGADRFERFWTSNADVQTAFAGAFGIAPGAWVRDWGRTRYGAITLGPRMDAVTLLLSALVLAGLISVAAVVAARRRIH